MVTKAEVTEYINAQFDTNDEYDESTEIHTYWQKQQLFVKQGYAGSRLGVIQEWMSPEVAIIL